MAQPYILINSFDQTLLNPNARDNCSEPFLLLKDKLNTLGYNLELANHQPIQDCARILFFNATIITYWRGIKGFLRRLGIRRNGQRNWLGDARTSGITDRLVLFLWEGPAICPENFESDIYNQFSTIFTWNDAIVDGIRFHKYYLPIPINVPEVEKVKFSHKKLLVNISYNKFSNYPHELYSERRKAIRYFERVKPNDFDLYGFGWDDPAIKMGKRSLLSSSSYDTKPYPSYHGTVKNKWDVLPKYKFSLCYENNSNQLGWITEKIFDCIRADCVPIYWGAPNITDYVDSDAFINRLDFKSNKELEEYICGISENEYQHFRDAANTYLASERFKEFLSPSFVGRIIQVLSLTDKT